VISARIEDARPLLASLDLAESLAFYSGRLGFALRWQGEDTLLLERDGACLQFWSCDDRRIAEHTSCYLLVSDVDALHAEWGARGVAVAPPTLRDWGMREFYVTDPHGNLLRCGQPA
jgi:catechol 2,3-dioxygenase-like lactoylglutathione lyase family enzyme